MNKSKILFLILSLLYTFSLHSQTGWFPLQSYTTVNLPTIKFFDENTGYCAGLNGVILKSTNGGTNWFSISTGSTTSYLQLCFLNVNTGWITGYNGVMIKTTNAGQNWISQYTGTNVILCGVKFIDVYTGWAVGYNGTIIKTTNGGTNWSFQISNTSYNLTAAFILNNNEGYVGGDHGRIFRTTNGGTNWVSLFTGIENNTHRMYFVSLNTGWVPGTNGLIMRTTNAGSSWTFLNSGTTSWIITVLFLNAQSGFAMGANGTILHTTNAGDNWSSQISGTNYNLVELSLINSNTGWIAGDNGVLLKTTNGGLTLPPAPTLLYPQNQSTNITLTPAMTWGTVNGALNYKIQISTISNFNIITDSTTIINNQYPVPNGKLQNGITYFWRVCANTNLGTTAWSDVWYFSTKAVGIQQISTATPSDYKLYSNYPNPFNPATKIKFDQPVKSHTSLIVYDALGRVVQTLVNTELKEGTYEYTWDASKYNSGVYFVRIISDKFAETKKMMLVK